MARRAYVDGRFGQMHVRIAGPADSAEPPLICFHMSPMSGRCYERFIDRFAEATGRMAVAIDTPGFGQSDAPPAPPSIADYSEAMRSAIEALGIIGPVDLIGYHTGSMIAANLAAEYSALVRRVICISAPMFTDSEKEAMHRLYPPLKPSLDGAHLMTRWNGFVHYNLGRGLSLDDVADMFPDGLLGRNIAWWGHNAAFGFAYDLRLPEVAQPVLVLSPGDDLQAESRRAPDVLRNGRLVELPAWGHGFLDGFTEDAAALVASFLQAADTDPFGALAVPQSAAGAA
ncbi:MAG: alpha/beta fold hydrolase [Sphingomonadales bacterium]|nr:MAG: alpha/beta fold hydrolase [Sphingomonadales bacterium]